MEPLAASVSTSPVQVFQRDGEQSNAFISVPLYRTYIDEPNDHLRSSIFGGNQHVVDLELQTYHV